jgi:sensor histidine kinase YesM
VIPDTLDHVTQGELQRYENNYKVLNLITTNLGRNIYDRVAHLETTHDVWLKLGNTYEGSSEIMSSRRDTYNRQYQIFSQKPGESLDDSLLALSLLLATYVHVVLLLILIMNVLNNCCMLLMILYGA